MVITISTKHGPLLNQTGLPKHAAGCFGCKSPAKSDLNTLKGEPLYWEFIKPTLSGYYMPNSPLPQRKRISVPFGRFGGKHCQGAGSTSFELLPVLIISRPERLTEGSNLDAQANRKFRDKFQSSLLTGDGRRAVAHPATHNLYPPQTVSTRSTIDQTGFLLLFLVLQTGL